MLLTPGARCQSGLLEGDWAGLENGQGPGPGRESPGFSSEQLGTVQLVHVPLGGWEGGAAGDTVMSNASNASRRTVNLVMPSVPEGAAMSVRGGRLPGEPAPAPWVQQPSVLRRLRSQSGGRAMDGARRLDSTMSLPLPPRSRPGSRLSAVLSAGQQRDDSTSSTSLPLPPDPTRPALPRLAAASSAAAREPTLSLPLPARLARPPIYRLPASQDGERGGEAPPKAPGAQQPAGNAAAVVTLKGAAAHSIREQLQQSLLEQQREAAAELPPSPEAPAAAADGESAAGDSLQADGDSLPANRRHVFTLASMQGSQAPPPEDASTGVGAAEECKAQQELLSGALTNGVTYMIGHSKLRPAPKSNKFKVRPRAGGGGVAQGAGCGGWWRLTSFSVGVDLLHPGMLQHCCCCCCSLAHPCAATHSPVRLLCLPPSVGLLAEHRLLLHGVERQVHVRQLQGARRHAAGGGGHLRDLMT